MGVQMDIFTASQEPFKFTKPIKVIELFAGYGSQMLAFEYLKANASHFKICEWAVPSIMAYNLIHIRDFTDYSRERERDWLIDYLADRQISMDYNKPMTRAEIARKPEEWLRKVYNSIIATKDTVDITRTHGNDFYMEDRGKYNVFMSYSFPCQDCSTAGYMKGMEENSGTRSSMLWQVSRILYEMKEMNQLPDVLMMENVPPVCSGKNYKPFNRWLQLLDGLGYTSFVKILSATEFGVPQTRKRCFVVSILGNKSYEFPIGWKLDKCLRDIVEKEVDERYYLTEKQMRNFEIYDKPLVMGLSEIERVGTTHSNFNCRSEIEGLNGAAATLSATDAAHPILLKIGDRIRKITPIECFRLMGVRDEDYNKIKDEFPPSKLYHLAGDSIVVDVLMNIFKKML